MVIAVNTRFLIPGQLEGIGYFAYETLRRMVSDHPEHQFLFITDRLHENKLIESGNVRHVVTGPQARHPLLWKFWYDVRIPALLKKYTADVFVSLDGFCSLHTRVPQCLVVHDLAFLHHPGAIRRSHLLYYKRYTPRFLARAATIATVSAFSKTDLIEQYDVPGSKIEVVYNGVRETFRPLSVDERTATKEKYTACREYFVYTGAIHPRKNLVNLLKAFSIFKRRQQSGIKLVITGRLAWKFESFVKDLASYKYRADVVMTGYVPEEELVNITGAAYAMVYPSRFEGFGVPVLEAMRCGVPVITSAGSAMQEIAGDAALYANPEEPDTIADNMRLIYKDENLRKELVSRGYEVAEKYSWDNTAARLWNCILKASGK